ARRLGRDRVAVQHEWHVSGLAQCRWHAWQRDLPRARRRASVTRRVRGGKGDLTAEAAAQLPPGDCIAAEVVRRFRWNRRYRGERRNGRDGRRRKPLRRFRAATSVLLAAGGVTSVRGTSARGARAREAVSADGFGLDVLLEAGDQWLAPGDRGLHRRQRERGAMARGVGPHLGDPD